MTAPKVQEMLTGLARRMVEKHLLSEADALSSQQQAHLNKIPFLAYLIHNLKVGTGELAWLTSEEFGIPLMDIDSLDLKTIPYASLDEKLVRQHQVLPIAKRESRLYVAVFDPTNFQALNEIKFNTGLDVEPVLVEEDKLASVIEKACAASQHEELPVIEIMETAETARQGDMLEIDSDDAPIVRFVSKILLDAIRGGASDIHFEPYESQLRIRYRLDGILRVVTTVPITQAARIAARIKIMSRLDISERRIPQDGRIKLRLSKTEPIDFRVNTCPTLFGEKVVLRILESGHLTADLRSLGCDPKQEAHFLKAIERPQGLILVTGPTGSGKTVTLYTAIRFLNTEERNISTVEDPVEIHMPGINQVNVNLKAGLTFSTTLRAFLRQDPDVIMVGEVRDKETAEIAIKAAQTGHLVLSTLHTNSAPETLTRLMNMGVEAFNVASSVSLVVAQRLVRLLCKECKRVASFPLPLLLEQGFTEEEARDLVVYQAVGCPRCYQGYRGRTGIYQVLPVGDELRRLIMNKGNAIEISDLAKKEGITDLKHAAREKVKAGMTSLEEMARTGSFQ